MNYIFVTCVLLICVFSNISHATDCEEGDLQYTYTECDAQQNRWRVSVPKPDKTCRAKPDVPVPGPKCDKACPPGKYLDVAGDQECKDCRAGSYSVGGGVRFDQWDKLPHDFSVSKSTMIEFDSDCPSEQDVWVPRGQYLEGVPNKCFYDLAFTVDLIKAGTLTVKYMNTYKSLISIIQVKSLCQSGSSTKNDDSGAEGMKSLKSTRGDDYSSETVDMLPGKNRVTFSLLSLSGAVLGNKFAIQSIEITGIAFTSVCTPCKPGFYSSSGSSFCTHCGEDKYAPNPGASECLACGPDKFSPPGSSECKPRPPCTVSHYYTSLSACANGTTRKTYTWLQPKYCNDGLPASVQLPPPGGEKDCPPCDPGQALSASGKCEYCADGAYSDGSKPCRLCPLHTEARKSLTIEHFDVMPERLSTSCIHTSNSGASFCDKQSTWIPKGSFIQVADDILDEDFAVLNINISEFSPTSLDGRVYGTFTIQFDMICDTSDPCLLYLMQDDTDLNSIMSWKKSVNGSLYVHNFTRPDVRMLSLAFVKSITKGDAPSKNTLKVHKLSLLNTVIGGASHCVDCVLGSSATGCRSCKAGEIIATNNSTNEKFCKKCPPNHVIVDSFTCRPCGYGLVSSDDFSECVSDCRFTSPDGLKLNFSPLAGTHHLVITRAFTGDGAPLISSLNFTLCSLDLASSQKPLCGNEKTGVLASIAAKNDDKSISSLVCRETILPADTLLSIQPASLGDTLSNITTNDAIERAKLRDHGVRLDEDELSIHFRYDTAEPTEHCTEGLATTITLICDDREAGNGTKSIPPHCVGGTCDGCHYQMVWRTELACPQCEPGDYEKIIGECNQGTQTVHYLPHKYCPITDEIRSKKTMQACTRLTSTMKIGIAAASVVGVILLVCVICCWKRSRKLEYKYMRLVEGAQGNAGELPAAQTCAWSDDDDEDDDRVAFKTKGDQLFGKLGKNRGKTDGFENMKLVGSSLPEI